MKTPFIQQNQDALGVPNPASISPATGSAGSLTLPRHPGRCSLGPDAVVAGGVVVLAVIVVVAVVVVVVVVVLVVVVVVEISI